MRILALFLFVTALHADDWPQWLGPQRDGVWRETGIVETFPEGGPKVLWRVKIQGGYTGPAVVDGKVYVMDRQVADQAAVPGSAFARGVIPGTERVLCLDAATGKRLWEHRYDCTYTMSYSTGPRCTPLVSDGKVWTLGAEEICFASMRPTARRCGRMTSRRSLVPKHRNGDFPGIRCSMVSD